MQILNNGALAVDDPEAGGAITGTKYGLYITEIEGGAVTIANHFGGTIEGTAKVGLFISDVSGEDIFVVIANGGDADRDGGTISGGDYGIDLASIGGGVEIGNRYGRIEGGGALRIQDVTGDVTIDTVTGTIEGDAAAAIVTEGISGLVTIDTRGGLIRGSGEAVDATATGITIVNGGVADGAGGVLFGRISGGEGPVLLLHTDAYDPVGETGGAVIENGAGGIIAADILFGDTADLDAAAGAVAVQATGGRVLIENAGTLVGRLDLTLSDDVVEILGAGGAPGTDGWVVTGDSDFGDGMDALFNAGRIRIIGEATFLGLETFRNAGSGPDGAVGLIDMQDGAADGLLTIGGDYDGGAGSGLRIDAVLRRGGAADRLVIEGAATGVTRVAVADLGDGWSGYDPEGILVVEVGAGAEGAGFTLAGGPIVRGFFSYDLVHEAGADADRWYLRSAANETADQLVELGVAAPELWHLTTGPWADRMGELRGMAGGDPRGQTAASSFDDTQFAARPEAMGSILAEDAVVGVPSAPRGEVAVWARAFGSGASWRTMDQRSWGVQTGVDRAVWRGRDDALLLGALLGYAQSTLDFGDVNGEAELRGPIFGAYASYVAGRAHLDALVKADFLAIDYTVPGDAADTKGVSLGVQLEAGYRIHLAPATFLEPRLGLAYVRSSIDAFELMGSRVTFEDGESLQGLIGLRASTTLDLGGARAVPFVAVDVGREFLGDAAASIDSAGPAVALSEETGGTFGQLGFGLDLVDLGGGVSAHARGGYRFGSDVDVLSGSLGLRVRW